MRQQARRVHPATIADRETIEAMSPRWRRSLAIPAVIVLGGVGVIAIEAAMATRVERLPPFPPGSLDGLFGAGSDSPRHLVWLGDSTGDGVGASAPERTFPRLVVEGLGGPIKLTVLARSGARVGDVLKEQIPRLHALAPDDVIVAVGGNDVTHLTPASRFGRDVDRVLEAVADAGPTRVAVIGIGEFAATPLFAQPLRALLGLRSHRLDRELQDAAGRHSTAFVDIAAQTGADFARDPTRFHARDRFHPSDDGYALWARATVDTLAAGDW